MSVKDPFAVEGNFQAPQKGVPVHFRKIAELSAIDRALIDEMGKRATLLITAVQKQSKTPHLVRVPAPTWAAAEIASAHVCRDLDLRAMHQSDDLAFMADYLAIVNSINRAACYVPPDVRLRFARN